nr:unnamed protein product [Digitaria exilis]
MSTNIGVLVPHFGGDSYKIRNALVGVLGKLVAKAFKDVEGDNNARLRSKQAMLEILIERCRDVSAYTRSRVLQVWAELCEENSISIGHWNEVASVASGRLEDKSAIVRKSALQLLITMLQHNPFGPQLRIATFEGTLEKYKERLQGMEPPNPDEDEPVNDSSLGEVVMGQNDSVSDSCVADSQDQNDPDPTIVEITNLEQIRALVASLEAGLRQFQIEGSEAALRKMLPLVFSQDKSIYEAVESAFITIYTRKSPTETAKIRKIQKQKRKNENSQPTTEDPQLDAAKRSEAQGINAELGLGATIDIAIESLAERAEKEIFPELQASAMLALCRLMIIDAEF